MFEGRRPASLPTSPARKEEGKLPTSSTIGVNQQEAQPRRRETKCWDVAVSFPSKLFNILEQAETEGFADLISFLPDGKAFMIHKPDEFSTEILPKYFKTRRLSSFQKQLSLYGFKRLRHGADVVGAFHHEFFQRDDKKLVAKIQRKKQRVPSGEPIDEWRDRTAVWRALGATGRYRF